jgi:predicted ATP-binding protein involved in virulence
MEVAIKPIKPMARAPKTMHIKQISVNGLFGIFDHAISLNTDERITIIHGPNGFGKTAILKLLNGFFNSQYSVLWTIPFDSFRIQLDDNSVIEITRNYSLSEENDPDREKIFCNFYGNSENKSFIIEKGKFNTEYISPLKSNIYRGMGGSVYHNVTFYGDVVHNVIGTAYEDNKENLPLISKTKSDREPEWVKDLKENIHIRLIESQRLLNSISKHNSGIESEISSMLPTVTAYSEELSQLIQAKLAEYGTTSQSLDRTFPSRVVQKRPSQHLTDEQLHDRLDNLEVTRSRLIGAGLLDKNEATDFQVQPQSIDESTKNILSLYVEDVEKKLSVFDEIANKIDLLKKIINNKFSYSYKEINFDKEKGFVFKTLHNSSSISENISPTDLSSGEQHELVLLYELLFKVQPNSLVLIDEPELSLHVGWQVQFLKDLQEITKLADLDVLMATHSPDIIQDRWDLTVELKGPAT